MNKMLTHFYWYGFSCFWLLAILKEDALEWIDLLVSAVWAFTSWGGVIAVILDKST